MIPILGPRAFEHQIISNDINSPANNITTACELFVSAEKRLACFQLRSPLVTGARLTAFFNELYAFLSEQQMQQFIILTGMFSHEQHSIGASKFMYLANERFTEQNHATFERCNDWLKWSDENGTKVIHGGGFALKLYKRISATLSESESESESLSPSIPCCIFFKYTAEGDNRNDATEIVTQLNRLIDGMLQVSKDDSSSGSSHSHQKIKLTIPISWKSMFGNDPSEQLY